MKPSIKIRRILDIFRMQSVIIDNIENDLKSMKIAIFVVYL